uniref:Si:dkeyp-75b4.9 n=1 Tax=Cyprinus carpio TaxID=7962 RepID=A0A8C2GA16_CYPCA
MGHHTWLYVTSLSLFYILIVYCVHLSVQFNPLKPITEEDPKYNKNPTLKDRIHCLVAVLPANTVSMMDETSLHIIRQMSDVRKKARDLGIPQVIIMTKVDESCPLVKDDLKKIYTSTKIKQKVLCFKFLTMVNNNDKIWHCITVSCTYKVFIVYDNR